MHRTISSELETKTNEQVMLKGWLHNLRKLGKINFLLIRDRSGIAQVVIENQVELEKVKDLQPGSILQIVAEVKETSNSAYGVELVNPEITVLNAVKEPMPLDLQKDQIDAHIDTILDYRPISLRHQKYRAIFKIQAVIVQAYREYLINQGFTEFFGPNIISASSEGGSELFTVNYFDTEAKLSQSAQLYKQMMVGVYERVFALMKCFRAEKSNTRRHLTEATQFEFEMGFIEDYTEIMDMLENVIKYIVEKVNEKCAWELKILGVELAKAPKDVKFPRIAFKDALELYYKRTSIDERNEIDLSPAAEKDLCAYAREEFGTDFIFVTNFLRIKTAFYAQPNAENPQVTNYFDLLCREAEITSGGQRIHEVESLEESLRLKGLDPKDFKDYLSIFKYGMPKHGGFGMGMERLTMLLLGLDNIREATLFPSDPKRIAAVPVAPKIYMGSDLTKKILEVLNHARVEFKLLEHEATPTSEDSANVRGTSLVEGVKAIILKGKKTGSNIMVCLSADKKLDMQQIADKLGEKFEFEKPDVIKDKFGLEVGAIPPFGNLLGIKTYFTSDVSNESVAAFNCGATTKSIIMQSKDLLDLVEHELL